MTAGSEWIVPGATVAIITFIPGTSHHQAARATVDKVTATQIVVGGARFDRDTLNGKGRTTWGPSSHLARLDAPEAREAFARQVRANTVRRAIMALQKWKNADLADFTAADEVTRLITAGADGVAKRLNAT